MGRARTKQLALRPGWVMYLRTSDEDAQAPERSQASQRRLIAERLVNNSELRLPLLGEYSDTYSGRKADRENYQRMLGAARRGEFSHVAVAFVDRFGRNSVEGLRAFEELTALGIIVRIATLPQVDPASSSGRMFVSVLFSMARFESDTNGDRTRENMKTKLLSGGWTWVAPDGYLNQEIKSSALGSEEKLKNARYKRYIVTDEKQLAVWRLAWKLLLEDGLSLSEICETLHARGYRLRNNTPFIRVKNNRREPNVGALSRGFHNWFYAGWVVVDNDWVSIPPKTVRGDWEPAVSTEDFEAALAILEKRNMSRSHRRKHFYLLQNLIWLEKTPGNKPLKLISSTPNSGKKSGGVPYYCLRSSDWNFLCREIDQQIPQQLQQIQVDPVWIPQIREAYIADIKSHFGPSFPDERTRLEAALKEIVDEEISSLRLRRKRQISDEAWEVMSKEWADQRNAIKSTLEGMQRNIETHVDSLDQALTLIAKAGILFEKLDQQGQRDLLRHIVNRVVINSEGCIIRVELRTPFSYLHSLSINCDGHDGSALGLRTIPKNKTSRGYSTGSSILSLGVPGGTLSEPPGASVRPIILQLFESIEYPQRAGLDRLLTGSL